MSSKNSGGFIGRVFLTFYPFFSIMIQITILIMYEKNGGPEMKEEFQNLLDMYNEQSDNSASETEVDSEVRADFDCCAETCHCMDVCCCATCC